MYLGLRT